MRTWADYKEALSSQHAAVSSQHSAISIRESAVSIGINVPNQRRKHLLDFMNIGSQSLELLLFEKRQIMREEKVIFELAGRAHSDLEETVEFAVTLAPATFCDVGRDRRTASSHL